MTSNDRGQYGQQRGQYGHNPWVGAVITRQAPSWTTEMNLGIIGVGLTLGLLGWPRYKKEKPFGVIALGASGSMISAGIVGLLLGQPGGSPGS